MAANLDPLLLRSDDFVIIRDISKNIDTSRLDAYIREAQVNELRSFLGDELYKRLVDNYGEGGPGGPLPGAWSFLDGPEGWSSAFGFTYVLGRGWVLPEAQTGQLLWEQLLFEQEDLEGNDTVLIELDVNSLNTLTATALINITPAFAGSFAVDVFGTGLYQTNSNVIQPGGVVDNITFTLLGSGSTAEIDIRGLRLISQPENLIGTGQEGDDDINALYDGADYTRQGVTVRFHGLKMAHLYWSYARFLNNQAINLTRYGVKNIEDENSTNIIDTQTRLKVNEAKSMALMYQEDARRYLEENRALYPEWEKPGGRIKTKKSFMFFRA